MSLLVYKNNKMSIKEIDAYCVTLPCRVGGVGGWRNTGVSLEPRQSTQGVWNMHVSASGACLFVALLLLCATSTPAGISCWWSFTRLFPASHSNSQLYARLNTSKIATILVCSRSFEDCRKFIILLGMLINMYRMKLFPFVIKRKAADLTHSKVVETPGSSSTW